MMSGLSIRNIHKSFGKTQVLRDVSFEIEKGEIIALLGPSGCGKSTLLSIIAGLENQDSGEIDWDGVHTYGDILLQSEMLACHRGAFVAPYCRLAYVTT